MTYYAGLDISMKTTSIAIINEKGKIVFEWQEGKEFIWGEKKEKISIRQVCGAIS